MKMSYVLSKVKDASTPLYSNSNSLTTNLKLIAFLLLVGFLSPVLMHGQSADLDQVRNGSASSPVDPVSWVNGNAGPSNAHFSEGYSIPYRVYLSGLTAGQQSILIIQWDTKHGNGHAIDYITHYDNIDNPIGSHNATFGHPAEAINPLMGYAGPWDAPTTKVIPAPSSAGSEITGQPTASFNLLNKKNMTIWNGVIDDLAYANEQAPDGTTNQTTTDLVIKFTPTKSYAMISWGGHIAAEYDWTMGRGATGVSGSPYHTRILSLDGKPGNQDRSLKASAVVIPPPECKISNALFGCPETTSFTYSYTGITTGVTFKWALTDPNNTAGAEIKGSTTGSSVVIGPKGSLFVAGGTFGVSLTVTRSTGQAQTCSLSTAGTIVKVVVQASASPTNIDLAVSNTSQLGAVLTGSDDTDPTHYSFKWTQTPASDGSLNDPNIQNPVFTATKAGSWEFEVTATRLKEYGPECVAKSKVTVNAAASMPPCKVNGPDPICPATTNSYIYDPNNDNVADDIPANFTAEWTLESNTNGASISGSTTGKTVSVVSTSTCNSAYTIKITLKSTSGLITTSCEKMVTVDDDVNPVISCPPDVNLQCGESTEPGNTGTATATDNCTANPTISHTDAPVAANCTGQMGIDRTWKATDGCGNIATCVQKIRFVDEVKPEITCPPNVNLECGESTDPSNTGTATGTDNCGTPNISHTDEEVPANCTGQKGINRTWKATDGCGNFVTCVQEIRFVDNTPPVITSCPGDKIIECDASIDPANTGMPTGTDNCSKANFTYTDDTKENGCQKIITRTWIVKDDCGNTGTPCVQHIITRDRTAPIIDCSAPGDPIVTDNCSTNISLFYKDDGNTRTWTAVDESGNYATCIQNLPPAPPVSNAAPSSGEIQSSATTKAADVTTASKVPAPVVVDDLEVIAYPNPFGTVVNFQFVSPKSGKAVLEIYDLLGRRVGIAYQGNLEANEKRTVVYKVPNAINSPIVYKLSVSDLSAHGKLMSSRK